MKVRTSILGMMGVIAVAGGGLAAFRTASALWACVLFTFAFLATVAATIVAVAGQGRLRASAAGFAIACGAYIGFVFGVNYDTSGVTTPPLCSTILFNWTETKIGTKAVIAYGRDFIAEDPLDDANHSTYDLPPYDDRVFTPGEKPGLPPGLPDEPLPSRDREQPQAQIGGIYPIHHRRIGHTLTALLLGLAGAGLGRWVASRNDHERAPRPA